MDVTPAAKRRAVREIVDRAFDSALSTDAPDTFKISSPDPKCVRMELVRAGRSTTIELRRDDAGNIAIRLTE